MSADDTHRYIVAYDILDDRRRTRLAAALLEHGDRLQFSVFVVDARPARLVRLRATMRRIIDPATDSVLVCDLGPLRSVGVDQFSYIGQGRPVTPTTSLIV